LPSVLLGKELFCRVPEEKHSAKKLIVVSLITFFNLIILSFLIAMAL
jgi:hypothetical protein